jgi:hypothetical protein
MHDEHLALRTNYWNPKLKRRTQKTTVTTTKKASANITRPMNVVNVTRPMSVTSVVSQPQSVVETTTVVSKPVQPVVNSYVTTEQVVSNGGRYRNNLL